MPEPPLLPGVVIEPCIHSCISYMLNRMEGKGQVLGPHYFALASTIKTLTHTPHILNKPFAPCASKKWPRC